MGALAANPAVVGDGQPVRHELRRGVAGAEERQLRQLVAKLRLSSSSRTSASICRPGCTDSSRWTSTWRLSSRPKRVDILRQQAQACCARWPPWLRSKWPQLAIAAPMSTPGTLQALPRRRLAGGIEQQHGRLAELLDQI